MKNEFADNKREEKEEKENVFRSQINHFIKKKSHEADCKLIAFSPKKK